MFLLFSIHTGVSLTEVRKKEDDGDVLLEMCIVWGAEMYISGCEFCVCFILA